MAVISATATRLSTGGILYFWEQLSENDTAGPVYPDPTLNDKTFMITGSFGAGAVALRGTLDPDQATVSSFQALNDYDGDAIAPTAAGAHSVRENCVAYAPGTPAGTSVDVDCWLLCV